MSQLVDYERRVQQLLACDSRTPHWAPEEAARYMADVAVRRQQFEQIASHLSDEVVQPRLSTLASYFPDASLIEDEPPRHCTCWFEYSDRFPATTKVAFAIEHDVRYEQIAICYDAHMMPMFVKFNEHDRLTLTLDE